MDEDLNEVMARTVTYYAARTELSRVLRQRGDWVAPTADNPETHWVHSQTGALCKIVEGKYGIILKFVGRALLCLDPDGPPNTATCTTSIELPSLKLINSVTIENLLQHDETYPEKPKLDIEDLRRAVVSWTWDPVRYRHRLPESFRGQLKGTPRVLDVPNPFPFAWDDRLVLERGHIFVYIEYSDDTSQGLQEIDAQGNVITDEVNSRTYPGARTRITGQSWQLP